MIIIQNQNVILLFAKLELEQMISILFFYTSGTV
jgi:hypothetical protein